MINVLSHRTCSSLYVYIYISRYHGKRGISLWVIRYIPQFELAVRHLGINRYCSLSHLTRRINWASLGTVWFGRDIY